MWLLGPRKSGFGGAKGLGCEFRCFLAEGGASPRIWGNQPTRPISVLAHLGVQPDLEKIKVLKFKCIFRTFKLIARYSNYDFWIPGKILRLGENLEKKYSKIFFENQKSKFPKIWKVENFQKIRKSENVGNFENVKIFGILKIQKNMISEQFFRNPLFGLRVFHPPRK